MIKPKHLVAAIVLFLALFGGAQFYFTTWAQAVFIVSGLIVTALAIFLLATRPAPPLFGPGLVYLTAMAISTLYNLDIWPVAFSRLILAVVTLAVLVVSHHFLRQADIFDGLYLAGMWWLVVWLFATMAGWRDNRNITAVWSVVFITVSLAGRKWDYLLIQLTMLVFLGSRGAYLAAIAAVLVMVQPWVWLRGATFYIFNMVGLMAVLAIIAYRPSSNNDRIQFWIKSLTTFDNPFGLGPGGIKARQFLQHVDYSYYFYKPGFKKSQIVMDYFHYYPHAHNFIFSTWAEMGLIGLAALVVIGYQLSRININITRWQMAIITGLMVHSLVDEPLWWPGPLLVFAIICGSIGYEKKS